MSEAAREEMGLGIIGCGSVAPVHGEAAAQAAGVRLVGFLGRSPERAQAMGRRFGVPWSVEREAFLAQPAIEAVLIGTPSGTHAELGIAAARAGKHVLVEKPIEVVAGKAQALIAACAQAGVRLGVVLQSRMLPAVGRIRRALDQGRLGRLVLADAYVKWQRSEAYYSAAAWRGTLAQDGGGALINQAIHSVDLLQYLAGPVASVFGHATRARHLALEGEDTALALLRYASGAAGVVEAATSIAPGFARRIELCGTEGSIVLEGNVIREWLVPGGGEDAGEPAAQGPPSGAAAASDPAALDTEPHRLVIEDFARAVREGRPPAVDGEQGLRSLEMVLAIYRSAREGRVVTLS